MLDQRNLPDLDMIEGDYGYEDYGYDDYTELLAAYREENAELMIEDRMNSYSVVDEITRLGTHCVGTVLWQSIDHVKILLLLCTALRFIVLVLINLNINHQIATTIVWLCSCLFGIFALHSLFSEIFVFMLSILLFAILFTYFLNCSLRMHLSDNSIGIKTALFTVSYTIVTELVFSNSVAWNRMRGTLLMLSMKIISVSIDLDKKKITVPRFFEYAAYCLHPGTVVFGPWIAIQDFNESLLTKTPVNFEWVYCIAKSSVQALVCLLLSTCFLPYLFLNPLEFDLPVIIPTVANNWMLAYENAVSFHFSHFYISYLATVFCLISGVGAVKLSGKNVKSDDDEQDNFETLNKSVYTWSKFVITKPLTVIVPHSLVSLVVAWNIPMSKWLKVYVFDTSRFLGDFTAILFTYAASALLHGLSFHLAAILLSLAFYTYTEHSLRLKLSRIFNCPAIAARPKSSDYDNITFLAMLFNWNWIAINTMHLAYLGSMFQSEEDESDAKGYSFNHTLTQWSNLGYASHLFALACFVCNWLI